MTTSIDSITYVLDEDGAPIVEKDIVAWSTWFMNNPDKRIVAKDSVGNVQISTVFLGIDQSFGSAEKPLLYETMTFGAHSEVQKRYCTKKEALKGHHEVVKSLKYPE